MLNKIIQPLCFCILVSIYFSGSIPEYMDNSFIFNILLVNFVSFLSFLFLRQENVKVLKSQYIRIAYLFLISFIIVHFQAYIDYVLGNLNDSNYFLWVDTKIVSKALVISSIGFNSFMLGYTFNPGILSVKKDRGHRYLQLKSLNILALIFLFLFFLTVDKSYLSGNYGASDIGSSALQFSFIFEAIVFAIIIIKCRNLRFIKQTKLSFGSYVKSYNYTIVLLMIYLTAVMFSGDRGPIIYCGLAFLLGYIYVTKRRIGIVRLSLILFIGAMFLSLLGSLRQQDRSSGFSDQISGVYSADNSKSYYPASFLTSTEELASSVRTVHLAVSQVPSIYSHFYGAFFIQDVLLLIPMSKGILIQVFQIPPQLTSSSMFLTWIDLGAFATWGVGSSCIADTYLDFGVFGVILVFLIFGFFTRKMELIIFSNVVPPIYLLVIVFVVFSFSIYIARSTVFYSLSKFTYVLIFSYVPLLLKRR